MTLNQLDPFGDLAKEGPRFELNATLDLMAREIQRLKEELAKGDSQFFDILNQRFRSGGGGKTILSLNLRLDQTLTTNTTTTILFDEIYQDDLNLYDPTTGFIRMSSACEGKRYLLLTGLRWEANATGYRQNITRHLDAASVSRRFSGDIRMAVTTAGIATDQPGFLCTEPVQTGDILLLQARHLRGANNKVIGSGAAANFGYGGVTWLTISEI